MQSKNKFYLKMNSLSMILVVFISSLFFYNCSTSLKNQETAMSSPTPNRGLAAVVKTEKSCPKGFVDCTSNCSSTYMECCPVEYRKHTQLLTSKGQLDCNVRPGYVKCGVGCCKIPKSYCSVGSVNLCPRNSMQAHVRGETETPARPSYYNGKRLTDSVFFAGAGGPLVPEGTRIYGAKDKGRQEVLVCKDGIWDTGCPEGQVVCGNSCCVSSYEDNVQDVSQ